MSNINTGGQNILDSEEPIFDSTTGRTEVKETGLDKLILAITVHFIGNTEDLDMASQTILNNLRCPTLSDYRWYKDVFMTL